MRTVAAALMGVLMAAAPLQAAEPPAVVATVKPLHSLVSAVMDGVGEAYMLVPDNASPHDLALKPSDARALQDADVVFWIGETVEPFLPESLKTLAADAAVFEALALPGIPLLPVRDGGVWEAHEEGHDGDDAGDHGGVNGHIWLDPAIAVTVSAAIAETLAKIDPQRAAVYRNNARALAARLRALDSEIEALLVPVRSRPFIVFHDAYPYLERRYRLTARGSVTVDPDAKPGAKRIAELRELIAERGAVCIFAEPQFAPAIVDSLVAGTLARSGGLDPIGIGLPPGPAAYFEMMRRNARALRECLEPAKGL